MLVTGYFGALRVGGRQIASFKTWKLDGTDASWVCSATLDGGVDQFLLDSPGAKELRLEIGRTRWRWRGVSAHIPGEGKLVVSGRGRPLID